MRNPAIQYPGDGGCSYQNCPNRRDARVKRGTMIPLGEIQSFAAGMGIHTECMKHILMGTNLLDTPTDGPYTTNVVAEGGSDD